MRKVSKPMLPLEVPAEFVAVTRYQYTASGLMRPATVHCPYESDWRGLAVHVLLSMLKDRDSETVML